ncbi:glycosyltransferase [bacterium]|nr:glycosyltransferase [bacterium]
MRIAILGTRGIPANYGGFETFAEEISKRLVKAGHEVTVYGRSNYIRPLLREYEGVRLEVLPNVMHKYLDTPVNTALASLHVLFRKYDVLLYCNSANALCTLVPRMAGHRVALNVDGLEWKRAKWNAFGRAVYRVSEYLSTWIPNVVVTDAGMVRDYYWRKFRKSSVLIPYGTSLERMDSVEALKRFGLRRRNYLLYVSRLEPENNAHAVIQAFEKVRTSLKLVIVGDAPFSGAYIRKLKETQDRRILFTGYVFGRGYREFQSHAYAYIQATEVGGTHPALVEAMGHGNCILANDVPEHREVLGDAGLYFSARDVNGLADRMRFVLDHPVRVEELRRSAFLRARQFYSWERITSDYVRLFHSMARQ